MDNVHTLDWIQELNSRSRWYCDINSPKCETFPSPAELSRHIESAHGGSVPKVHIAAMIADNVFVSPGDRETCPICQESIDTKDGIMPKHIAMHLRSFAWLSIRYLDDAVPAASQDDQSDLESEEFQLVKPRRAWDLDDVSAHADLPGSPNFCSDVDRGNLSTADDFPEFISKKSRVVRSEIALSAPNFEPLADRDHSETSDPESLLGSGQPLGTEEPMVGANPKGTDNLDIPNKTSNKKQPSWDELNVEPAQEKAIVDDSQALIESEPPTAASPTHNTVHRGYGISAEPRGHSVLDLGSVSSLTRSNTKTALRSLGISIQKSLVESRFDAKDFLPRSCIRELITRATIFEVLVSETEIPNTAIIVDYVSQKARILCSQSCAASLVIAGGEPVSDGSEDRPREG